MSSREPRFERYAVYFSPPLETPIQQFAGHWFGRDTLTGERRSPLCLKGFSAADLTAITALPARYGFHATLKAPFRLSAEASSADLPQALRKLAATLEPRCGARPPSGPRSQ